MNPTEARAAAVAAVRAQLGLTNIPPSEWSYDTRVNYNKTLAEYIRVNAASFSAQDQFVAAQINQETISPLADTGLSSDLSAFGGEFVNQLEQAGGKVAAIGTGVLDTAQLAGKILPLVLLIGTGILIYSFYKTRPGLA